MARELPRPFQGRSDKVVKKPKITAKLPSDAKKEDLDFDSSFGVQIEETMATFVPVKGLIGKGGDMRRLLREPMTFGILINCVDQVWFVESEPTGPDTFGVIILAPQEGKQGWRSRKPILTGPCTIIENAPGDRTLKFDLKTIYDNVSASPRGDSLTVSGGISDGPAGTTYTTTVSYKIF
jgi:hypothetical protein